MVSQRSWVRFPFKPEFFFQVSSFQPLRLKHIHCDDLHIILSLSAVRIYEFHILMFVSFLVPFLLFFLSFCFFFSFLRPKNFHQREEDGRRNNLWGWPLQCNASECLQFFPIPGLNCSDFSSFNFAIQKTFQTKNWSNRVTKWKRIQKRLVMRITALPLLCL